ncbi:MAG TPA: ABC transporter permease, partial [Verrucomicrobiae bacterium]|nr:ABC transporter permease [Verrucomicrobiae bacterium]
MNDLKFAVRQLLKNPGFTAVAVLTLALGIGASTAIFSVVYGVLISPYPYARPNEIWTPGLRSVSSEQIMRPYPYTGFERMAKLPGYADVMATKPEGALLTGEYAPENMRVVRVSGSAFRFIGVPALIGRGIQPSDIRPNGEPEPVVVLSFNCWHRLFNGNTNALGKVLRLDEQPYTVVGVMPPRFGWWTGDGVWAPLAADSKIAGVFPIVRLEPGVSAEAARQQLHTLHLALAKERPADFPNDEFSTTLSNYMDMTVAAGEMHHSLWLLSGAVAFLLLIACANVANLQLARATSRAREMAIRLSMGARRARLIRQLLTESVLLSFVSGVCGLLLALWITQLMVSLMPGYFVPNEARIEINGRALLFCLAVSTLTGILFGLVPAFHSSRGDLTGALKDSGRGTGASASSGRTREILVVAEVVLSVVLLVSACLTIRSFAALQSVKLGYRADHVLLVNFPLSPKRYPTLEQRNQFARELLERAARLPGVQSAAFGNFGRPFGGPNPPYVIEGQPAPENRRILLQLVTPGYLDAFGVTMVRGRELTARDLDDGSRVTLINETAARLWPDGIDPIGKRIRIDMLASGGGGAAVATNASPFLTVIGI